MGEGPRHARLKPGPGRSREEVEANQLARLRAAMIELVAEHGFDQVTMRNLRGAAGVSTQVFYRHFRDAWDCFCAAYDELTDGSLERAIAARDGAGDWDDGLRAALRGVMREAAADPQAASLVLLGAFSAGPGMLPRIRSATAAFERILGEALAPALPPATSPGLAQAMIAATARVIRARLLTGRAAELPACADPLADWMLALADPRLAEVARLGEALAARPELWQAAGPRDETWLRSIGGDRAQILTAAAKLAAEHGYGYLTPSTIRAEAGVSRRRIAAEFEDVASCFLEAVRALVVAASAHAERASLRAADWQCGVYRATYVLCGEIARSPTISRLAFVDLFAPGRNGLTCRKGLIDLGTGRLRENAPPALRPSELVAEASLAGAWRLTYEEVTAGRAQALPQITPLIAYLVLAPVTGAAAALDTIRAEQYRLTGFLPDPATSVPGG